MPRPISDAAPNREAGLLAVLGRLLVLFLSLLLPLLRTGL